MKVFIDGSSGTTGLRIGERLAARADVELLALPETMRKDPLARGLALNSCDTAILCLPDAAAREAIALIENPAVRVLDTSTAHRTSAHWTYGFPELSAQQRAAIVSGSRISVPGCHASGFIALIHPLVAAGLLSPAAQLAASSITGYSGGGKAMIADYESTGRPAELDAPRQYGLNQEHKHLPEMLHYSGLTTRPLFTPIVSDYYSGMLVTVPLFSSQLSPGTTPDDLRDCYTNAYTGPVLRYQEELEPFISAGSLSGSDAMLVSVAGNAERILLLALYDNLGKGASGAAIQCLNLMHGGDESTGLQL